MPNPNETPGPFDDSETPFPKRKRFVANDKFNANSVLISIVMLLAGWNLKETMQQGRDFSVLNERTAQVTREMADLRIRMASNENQVVSLQLQLERLKNGRP